MQGPVQGMDPGRVMGSGPIEVRRAELPGERRARLAAGRALAAQREEDGGERRAVRAHRGDCFELVESVAGIIMLAYLFFQIRQAFIESSAALEEFGGHRY